MSFNRSSLSFKTVFKWLLYFQSVDDNFNPKDGKLFFKSLYIAPDKAAYCLFTQFRGPENAIKLISVHTKTQ